jgi:hypothetical protein
MLENGRFGKSVVFVEEVDQLVVGSPHLDNAHLVGAFDRALGAQIPADAVGTLGTRSGDFGYGHRLDVARLALGPMLIAGGWETIGERAWAGYVYLFQLPFEGHQEERDALITIRGDPGDSIGSAFASDDLDGDGWDELVLGAYGRAPGGWVGVISGAVPGEHSLWDIAFATFESDEATYSYFGAHVQTGDLDGDGQVELLVGSTLSGDGDGALHVFQGPIEPGAHTSSSSGWTIVGDEEHLQLGWQSVVADVNGDGAPDLAVAAPANRYFFELDGSVLVFEGPLAAGTYRPSDAAVVIQAIPGAGANGFGATLEAGDLNDDGMDDLIIGAPYDQFGGREVGSIHIMFGRSDIFPP